MSTGISIAIEVQYDSSAAHPVVEEREADSSFDPLKLMYKLSYPDHRHSFLCPNATVAAIIPP